VPLLTIAARTLEERPAGLVTDLDGTLAPIVPVPSRAQLEPGAAEALRALAERLAVVAVVTGRAALDARRMLGSAGSDVLVIGNHGLEWLEPGSGAPEPSGGMGAVRSELATLLVRLPTLPGVEVEEKGLSATIHYRQSPDPDQARSRLLAVLREADGGSLAIREGRMSIELRPVGRGDKGTALTSIVERFRLGGLLVAGDDVTDLDMFAAARAAEARGVRTMLIGVSGGHEVPDDVAGSVDHQLPDPAALVQLLAALAEIGPAATP